MDESQYVMQVGGGSGLMSFDFAEPILAYRRDFDVFELQDVLLASALDDGAYDWAMISLGQLLAPGLTFPELDAALLSARWVEWSEITGAQATGTFELVVIPIPEPGVWVPVLAGVGLVAARRWEGRAA